jgi:hypothetical protein
LMRCRSMDERRYTSCRTRFPGLAAGGVHQALGQLGEQLLDDHVKVPVSGSSASSDRPSGGTRPLAVPEADQRLPPVPCTRGDADIGAAGRQLALRAGPLGRRGVILAVFQRHGLWTSARPAAASCRRFRAAGAAGWWKRSPNAAGDPTPDR